MAYSRGKYAKAISDRSGQEFPYVEMVKEWNGSFVHISEFEPKHPQLDPPHVKADPEALRNARNARTETAVPTLLPLNAFTATNTSTIVTVFEPDHGRSNLSTVRFREAEPTFNINDINTSTGFTITLVDSNNYKFTSSNTATSSGRFGGGSASAGPVTVQN